MNMSDRYLVFFLSVVFLSTLGCSLQKSDQPEAFSNEDVLLFYDEGKYWKCISGINSIIQNDESEYVLELKYLKAKCYYKLEEVNNCISLVSEIVEYFPNDTLLLKMRADSYYKSKYLDKAKNDYDLILKIFPESGNTYKKRATLLYDFKEFSKSIADINSALKYSSVIDGELFAYKGASYRGLGEYDSAKKYLFKSLKVKPTPVAYDNLGWTYENLGIKDSACFYYKIAGNLGVGEGNKYYYYNCFKNK